VLWPSARGPMEPSSERTQQAVSKTNHSCQRSHMQSAAVAIPYGLLNLASSPPPLQMMQRFSQCTVFVHHSERLHYHHTPVRIFSDNAQAIGRHNGPVFPSQVATCPGSRGWETKLTGPRWLRTGSCRARHRTRWPPAGPHVSPALRCHRPSSPVWSPRPGWWKAGGQ
jgi:hypothetical protein